MYRMGGDVGEDEVLRDSRGRVVDDSYVEGATRDALEKARSRGRPSLSASGESPLLRVRLSKDLNDAVTKAARRTGKSRAEWVRDVLNRAARKAG